MDVLVTGATGRIGANTVKHLLEIGHQVCALVRPGSDRAEKLSGMSAGLKPENRLEHGFGVRKKGQPTDAWTEACVAWLRGHGVLKPGR